MGCSSSKELLVEMKQFHDKYQLGPCLGRGAFATVRLARCQESNQDFAVKILDLRGSDAGHAGRPTTERLRQELRAEQRAWSQVGRHPNIVYLQEAFADHYFGYFVMERCTTSMLEGWRAEPELSETVYARYFQEMAVALAHIHSLGVVHRDVKQDNFLLGGSHGRTVKLCDFGLSAAIPAEGHLSGVYGTAPYMSPEMVLPNSTHGEPCDVWSLGVIVYTAFFGCFPYVPREKNSEAMKQVIREGTPAPAFMPPKKFKQENVSDVALGFVKALLNRDPDSRPTAVQCLKLDYLANQHLHAQQARKRPQVSLIPLLHGAVRCGAFATRPPQADPNQEAALMELQHRANLRLAAANKAAPHRTGSPGGSEVPDEEPRQQSRRPASSKSGVPKMAWESGSTKAGSSSEDRSNHSSVAL